MAALNPPDQWYVSPGTGTWGVDAQSLGSGGIGTGGVKVGGTTAQPTLVGPWVPMDQTLSGACYNLVVNLLLGVGSTPTWNIKFVWYDSTRSVVKYTDLIATNPFSTTFATTVGITVSHFGKTAPWGRFEITKVGTQTGGVLTLYSALVERVRPMITATSNADQSLALVGTQNSVAFGTINASADLQLASGNEVLSIRKPGTYLFTVNLTVAATSGTLAAGTAITASLYDVGSSTALSPTFKYVVPNAAGQPCLMSWSYVLQLASVVYNTSGWSPQITVQANCSTTGAKLVSGQCTLGVVSVG